MTGLYTILTIAILALLLTAALAEMLSRRIAVRARERRSAIAQGALADATCEQRLTEDQAP